MEHSTRQLLEDLRDFEKEFLRCTAPGPDDQMMQRLRRILFRIQYTDSYLNEKKGKLERSAATWFSPRKWMKHPGGYQVLRVDVLGNIKSVVGQIEFLARA